MTRQAAPGAPTGATVEFAVHFRRGSRGRRRMRTGATPRRKSFEKGSIPRISRLMALAIHFDQLIRKGVVRDHAELASLGGVSPARLSQIMALIALAPAIQEAILFLPLVSSSRDVVTERSLRGIVAEMDWDEQHRLWTEPTTA